MSRCWQDEQPEPPYDFAREKFEAEAAAPPDDVVYVGGVPIERDRLPGREEW